MFCLTVFCGAEGRRRAGGGARSASSENMLETGMQEECWHSSGPEEEDLRLVQGGCAVVEVMDSSMAVADGAGGAAEGTTDSSGGHTGSGSVADENVPQGRVGSRLTPPEVAALDECLRDRGDAAGDADGVSPEDSAASADNRGAGPGHRGGTDARVECESDDECNGGTTCLEACMTPSGQDYYLRRGGTPRRRSALRLSRIIARQQLLRRLSQGRGRDYCQIFCSFPA